MFLSYYEKAIHEQLELSKGNIIYFWGASFFLEEIFRNIDLKKYNIEGIIDDDKNKIGQRLFGHKIFSPDIIENKKDINIIFTIIDNNEMVYKQISCQINKKNKSIKILPNVFSLIKKKYDMALQDIHQNEYTEKLLGIKFIKFSQKEINEFKNLGEDYKQYSEMSEQDRLFLYTIIRRFKPKKILEVGVSYGGSSYIILNAIKDYNAHLYSIDYNEYNYIDKTKKTGFYLDKKPTLTNKWSLFTGGLSLNFLDKISSGQEEEKFDFCLLDTVHMLPGEVLDYIQVLPYLKKDCVFMLHDTNLQLDYFVDIYRPKEMISNNILFSTIKGDKFLPDINVFPGPFGSIFNNIGAIRLNQNTFKDIFSIFNLLTLQWEYMLKDTDIDLLVNFIEKHYPPFLVFYFREVVRFQKIREEKKLKILFNKLLKFLHL